MAKLVYRFYLKENNYIPDSEWDDLIPEDRYPLYAFTNNESIAKEFRYTRNMNKFVEISSKMTKNEFAAFANAKSSSHIELYELHTCTNKFKNRWKDIDLAITWMEKESIHSLVESFIEKIKDECVKYDPSMLSKKIYDALCLLEYTSLYSLNKDSFAYPSFMIDELALFMGRYKDIMKVEIE